MNRILLASTVLFAASSAYAADAVVYSEPAPVVADTFSWTGGYIGLNAGYAGGKFKHPVNVSPVIPSPTEPEPDPVEPSEPDEEALRSINASQAVVYDSGGYDVNGSLDLTASGFLGGIQAGYNWQIDRTVIGIETDIQATGLKGEFSGNLSNGYDRIGAEVGSKVKWFGTTRVRLGYLPAERFMIYATGGVAYGKVETYGALNFDGDVVGFSKSKTRVGYTVGAGAEYAFADNWTVKSEYLYTDLGKMKFSLADEDARMNVTTKAPFHTVRIGVNYKF